MCIVLQVSRARGLRAADLNGLSDPYCVVALGKRKCKTQVVPTACIRVHACNALLASEILSLFEKDGGACSIGRLYKVLLCSQLSA